MSGISPKGFSQEESYTDALAGRLVSPVYEGEFGFVEFRSTVVNNKGLEAAEKWSGIDFVILATISDDIQRVEKAIVFQCKKGGIENLAQVEKQRLNDQISKMQKITLSPHILEISISPTVVSANRYSRSQSYKHVELEDYFVRRVLTTFDGDTS